LCIREHDAALQVPALIGIRASTSNDAAFRTSCFMVQQMLLLLLLLLLLLPPPPPPTSLLMTSIAPCNLVNRCMPGAVLVRGQHTLSVGSAPPAFRH
jgi:hypothetical protein